jgi:ribosomal protein L11 methyltransferase
MATHDATRMARLRTAEADARRLADRLAETLDPDLAAVAAFESADREDWTVEICLPPGADEATVRMLAASLAGPAAAAALRFEAARARDWVAASLDGLAPVEAGRFVVHGAHDRARVAPNRIGIEIEAALAFGTGHHGTTRGCLLALDGWLKRERRRRPIGKQPRVLDIGTGTGVLAIAAAKALRAPVLASDIDAQAVSAARDNAGINGARGVVRVARAAGTAAPQIRRRGPYDLVFANILLGPLRRLARPIARLAAPRAHAVLSGLLPRQANAIVSAYRTTGLRLERRIDLDGWTTLVMTRG